MNSTELLITPLKALNKAYRRQKVNREEIESFRSNLSHLIKNLNEEESEEHLKNNVMAFLSDTWYKKDHFINTKGRTDFVIHQEKSPKSKVGVLTEVKRPSNRSEMISKNQLNAKALQELLLYYLREHKSNKDTDIKYLIVTNVYEWFIFDAAQFHKHFHNNKKLQQAFLEWESKQLEGTDNPFFYSKIASKYISEVEDKLEYTWFDLRDFDKELQQKEDSKKLIALFKVLSPVHLLKKPFANDSNSLNKQFYHELLHIIGLEEVKEKGKKVIQRKSEDKRIEGSFLENAILTMDERDRLNGLNRPSHFGETHEERLYTVALELCITWINRILFLKLMESQLVTYHKGDRSYRFLNTETVANYDALESLFFGVLAKRLDERPERYREKYARVPYLNSSLFEPTGLEEIMTVTMLNNNFEHELYARTVLKDATGRPLSGKMDALEYLFRFLEAYDFSSEGKEEIQEESKSLINASVLGLIFEKINGYKDGSFYTPGFITMYMCRETIRRAVVQKFNEAKGWKLESFDQLYDKIDDKKEANQIINSLKICDPAVGSGHFLVSALNEIIAIKSELKILLDREGKTLRDYEVTIENDELIVESEGELFQYTLGNMEKQRVQETLFHEKQTIIENCLFGVDINPNSVKICRLRLWIELLKNAYYKNDTELETLPNIDINIKTGNSLISRFDLDTDISEALKKSKWDVSTYRNVVNGYKNATRKEDKREFERLIEDIKGDFETEISKKDKRVERARKLKGELFNLTEAPKLFEQTATERKKWNKDVETKTKNLQKLEQELAEIKNNKIYEDAFEWRFEFPEVLDDEGNFKGFDVVIGNPPYIRIQDLQLYEGVVKYYSEYYDTGKKGNYDIYVLFIELGLKIGIGQITYILPHKFINSTYGEGARKLISENQSLSRLVHFGANQIFEDATTYTCLLFLESGKQDHFIFNQIDQLETWKENHKSGESPVPVEAISKVDWKLLAHEEFELLKKLNNGSKPLDQVTSRIFQGIKTSADKIYIVKEKARSGMTLEIECPHDDKTYEVESTLFHRLIKGGDSKRYHFRDSDLLILFPYESSKLIEEYDLGEKYPLTYKYLQAHKEYLENREGGSFKGQGWYQYGRYQAIDVISSPKIFTPDIAPVPSFMFDKSGEKYFTGGAAGGYGIVPTSLDKFYLLGVLNSSIVNWYISKTSTQMRGGWYSFESRFIKAIPIKSEPDDLSNSIALLVERALDKKESDHACDIGAEEKEIDQLVYELYGLSEEEIRIVEGEFNEKDNIMD
ncbi:MAG: Eco57I restriction-modification methylase domain-containing protein [Cyclobacteriaceae bacterium]